MMKRALQRGAVILGLAASAACAPRPAPMVEPPKTVQAKKGISDFQVSGKKYAFIINGDREERHRKNVSYAVIALKAQGFREQNIYILGHSEDSYESSEATKKNIIRKAAEVTGKLKPNDLLAVYVTGHGKENGFVVQDREILSHSGFVKIFQPAREKKTKTVFVFDTCFSGALPDMLEDYGYRGTFVAPATKGKETLCQFFAPYLWKAVRDGMDVDNDGVTTIGEIFRYSMGMLNTHRTGLNIGTAAGSLRVTGTPEVQPITELSSMAQLRRGNVIVEVWAEWCYPCKVQEEHIETFHSLYGNKVRIFKLHVQDNPNSADMMKKYEFGGSLPTLLVFKDGNFLGLHVGMLTVAGLKEVAERYLGIGAERNQLIAALTRELRDARNSEDRIAGIISLIRLGARDNETKELIYKNLERMNRNDQGGFARVMENLAFGSNPQLFLGKHGLIAVIYKSNLPKEYKRELLAKIGGSMALHYMKNKDFTSLKKIMGFHDVGLGAVLLVTDLAGAGISIAPLEGKLAELLDDERPGWINHSIRAFSACALTIMYTRNQKWGKLMVVLLKDAEIATKIACMKEMKRLFREGKDISPMIFQVERWADKPETEKRAKELLRLYQSK